LKNTSYGNGRKLVADYSNARHNLASLVVKRQDNTDTIINQGYDYYLTSGTNNNRVQKITDNVDGNYTTTFEYDDFNRLKKADATAFHRAFDYDAWGNLRNVTASGQGETGSYSLSYQTDAAGAPVKNQINNAGYSYDASGNQTSDGSATYTYDAESRLKTVGGMSNSREYDGDGRKVKQASGGSDLYYLWSSVLGEPVVELTSAGVYRAYVYGPNGQTLALQSYDGNFYWVHTDHLGSGRKLTNVSGDVVYRGEYDPHGQLLYEWEAGAPLLSSHKFAGYERDWATNLDYAKARTYTRYRGKFMQPEPLGIAAINPTAPLSLNSYTYCLNDPVNQVDIDGSLPLPIITGLIGLT